MPRPEEEGQRRAAGHLLRNLRTLDEAEPCDRAVGELRVRTKRAELNWAPAQPVARPRVATYKGGVARECCHDKGGQRIAREGCCPAIRLVRAKRQTGGITARAAGVAVAVAGVRIGEHVQVAARVTEDGGVLNLRQQ